MPNHLILAALALALANMAVELAFDVDTPWLVFPGLQAALLVAAAVWGFRNQKASRR